MKRSGNCRFLRQGPRVCVKVREWCEYFQEYQRQYDYYMHEKMFGAIKSPKMLRVMRELMRGVPITTGNGVSVMHQGFKIMLEDQEHIIMLYNVSPYYKAEPRVFIYDQRMGNPDGGVRMDIPSLYRLMNIENLDDLPEINHPLPSYLDANVYNGNWSNSSGSFDSGYNTGSSDSGYNADGEDNEQ